MSEKIKNKEEKATKPSKPKKPNIFVRFIKMCKEIISEIKKVVWPSRKQVVNNTIIVVGFIVAAGAFVSGIDWLFKLGIGFLTGN